MNQETKRLVWGAVVILVVVAGIIYLKPIIDLMRSGATTGPALSLSPAFFTSITGDTITVDILLDTSGTAIDGVDISSIRFDPAILQVQDDDSALAGIQITPGNLLPNTAINQVNNVAGTLSFSQLTAGGTTYSGSGKLATIHFTAISAGTSNITIDFSLGSTSDSNIAGAGTDVLASVINSSIFVAVSPVPTPTPISTKFKIGDSVQATTKISVRSTAGGAILGTQKTGSKGKVAGGPTSANSITCGKLISLQE